MSKRANSHDVARTAGVSQSTVSLVLSGKTDARIAEATRQRVLAAAEQLGYVRNATARALVTGRTNRIGVIANHPARFRESSGYYSRVMAGIVTGAVDRECNLLLHSLHYADWRALCADVLSGSVDGALVVGHFPEPELTRALIQSDLPVVCVSQDPGVAGCHAVDCDNEEGGRLAVRHLLSLGHKRIAYIHNDQSAEHSWVRERLAGAVRAMAEAEMQAEDLLVTSVARRDPPGNQRSLSLLLTLQEARPRPTGLFFADEHDARSFSETVVRFGATVPGTFAVVGFNSTDHSARSVPPLTSIYQPLTEIGETAVAMLADLVAGRTVPVGVRRLPVRLDVRESCGPPG